MGAVWDLYCTRENSTVFFDCLFVCFLKPFKIIFNKIIFITLLAECDFKKSWGGCSHFKNVIYPLSWFIHQPWLDITIVKNENEIYFANLFVWESKEKSLAAENFFYKRKEHCFPRARGYLKSHKLHDTIPVFLHVIGSYWFAFRWI